MEGNLTTLPVTEETIRKAEVTLLAYRAAKAPLEARLEEEELWWQLRHWEVIGSGGAEDENAPTSAWLFNNIANKHADAMDN